MTRHLAMPSNRIQRHVSFTALPVDLVIRVGDRCCHSKKGAVCRISRRDWQSEIFLVEVCTFSPRLAFVFCRVGPNAESGNVLSSNSCYYSIPSLSLPSRQSSEHYSTGSTSRRSILYRDGFSLECYWRFFFFGSI